MNADILYCPCNKRIVPLLSVECFMCKKILCGACLTTHYFMVSDACDICYKCLIANPHYRPIIDAYNGNDAPEK